MVPGRGGLLSGGRRTDARHTRFQYSVPQMGGGANIRVAFSSETLKPGITSEKYPPCETLIQIAIIRLLLTRLGRSMSTGANGAGESTLHVGEVYTKHFANVQLG